MNLSRPYLKRSGSVPCKVDDLGGAFPEIHILQYPLGMGREISGKPGSKILPLTVDAHGKVAYDAIDKQNENSKKIVYKGDLEREIEQTTRETKAALEKMVNDRLSAAQVTNSQFIKYKPSPQSSTAFNSGAKERMIKIVELDVDLIEPPKFQHKKFPKPSGSPPVPVLHSPPRPVTFKDRRDWKIPPCISNWKNLKGYTIPLSKRLTADGRCLQEVQVNDNFPKFSESLYVTEQKAREAAAMRYKVHKEMLIKENQRKEEELRALAQKARSERTALVVHPPKESENWLRREKIRERRLEEAKDASFSKKRKITRDKDRDISEKFALGSIASTGAQVIYDQRMFNQDKGMDSGFGRDDRYNVYDNRLFIAQPTLSTLYRPKKDNADGEMYGGDADEKILKTDRFKPDKGFSGAFDRAREGLVQFDKESDLFGLDKFLIEVNKGGKRS